MIGYLLDTNVISMLAPSRSDVSASGDPRRMGEAKKSPLTLTLSLSPEDGGEGTRQAAAQPSTFKEKISPSPGRGGGLTTAIANGRSHGIEPARADRSRMRVLVLAARLNDTTGPHG